VDVPDLEAILANVLDSVQPFQRDVQDRTGRWYSLRVRPYRTTENHIEGAVIALIDIDSIKQNAESLRVGVERLRIMYDRAPVGIFETDLDGRFVRVNDRFSELTGRTRDALLSLRSEDITHPDDLAAQREDLERIHSGAVPPCAARNGTSATTVTRCGSSCTVSPCRTRRDGLRSPSASPKTSRSAKRRRRSCAAVKRASAR